MLEREPVARTIVKYDRIVDSGYSKSIQCQVSDTIRRIVRIQNSPIIIPIFMITFMTHWSREPKPDMLWLINDGG